MSQRTLGRVAAHARPCCSSCSVVSRAVLQPPQLCRAHSRSYCVLPSAVSCLSCDTTQRPSHLPITIQFTPPAARPSRVRRSSLRAGWPCRRASQPCRRPSPQPYRGPVRPCPGRIVGVAAMPCLLCHDTMHCVVTKAGKWAVAHPAAIIFFLFSLIYIYIYIHLFTY